MECDGVTPVTCNSCGMFVFLPKDVTGYTCTKCKLVTCLENKVQQLEAHVSNHQITREHEDFLDGPSSIQNTMENIIEEEGSSQIQETDMWRNVTHRSRRPRNLTESLELQNRFQSLSLINQAMEQQQEQQCQPAENFQRTQEESEHQVSSTKL